MAHRSTLLMNLGYLDVDYPVAVRMGVVDYPAAVRTIAVGYPDVVPLFVPQSLTTYLPSPGSGAWADGLERLSTPRLKGPQPAVHVTVLPHPLSLADFHPLALQVPLVLLQEL